MSSSDDEDEFLSADEGDDVLTSKPPKTPSPPPPTQPSQYSWRIPKHLPPPKPAEIPKQIAKPEPAPKVVSVKAKIETSKQQQEEQEQGEIRKETPKPQSIPKETSNNKPATVPYTTKPDTVHKDTTKSSKRQDYTDQNAKARAALDKLANSTKDNEDLFSRVISDIKKVSIKPTIASSSGASQRSAPVATLNDVLPIVSDIGSTLGGELWGGASKLFATATQATTQVGSVLVDTLSPNYNLQPDVEQTSKSSSNSIRAGLSKKYDEETNRIDCNTKTTDRFKEQECEQMLARKKRQPTQKVPESRARYDSDDDEEGEEGERHRTHHRKKAEQIVEPHSDRRPMETSSSSSSNAGLRLRKRR